MTKHAHAPPMVIPVPIQNIPQIRSRLLKWGKHNFKAFSWRDEDDEWLTLVSEVLLQRTRAEQVEPIYLEFKSRFPTYKALLAADNDTLDTITSGLGIHKRTATILQLAQWIDEHNGHMPESPDELEEIRGIGPYTSAAWLSLHQGTRATIVDANVFRWLARTTCQDYGRDPRGVDWVYELADALTPPRAFTAYNYAVLDFTMTICTPANPKCPSCPIRQYCCFGKSGDQGDCGAPKLTPGITHPRRRGALHSTSPTDDAPR